MSTVRDLLVEIGTEELPPKALLSLSDAFGAALAEGLVKMGLAHNELHCYATPRRLALRIDCLSTVQADQVQERRGPAIAASYDGDGKPMQAALGFARACGVEMEQLERLSTDKGEWLVHRYVQAGKATAVLLPELIEAALAKLPVPKRMRWGELDVAFVRPVHWVVLLFGSELIETPVMGLRPGRVTYGHRFHHPAAILLQHPSDYPDILEKTGQVIADFAQRRESIRNQVEVAARTAGGVPVIDAELLDEVTSLVEWPIALLGRFEQRFLSVPQEALISTMKANQKYFHVVGKAGQLLPFFITICNIDSRDPAQVIAGNERVIRPRFSDAAFFWEQDRKQPLITLREGLKTVVYHQKLGSQYDKSVRVAALACHIAEAIGAENARVERAAALAKCDLLSHMVGEFPELQGLIGRYCAQQDGEDAEVALAIAEQYLPRYAGDSLPVTPTGQALALADKLDTLAGIFAIGQKPSGDKDPYGLRRAALGALRIMIEGQLNLDLENLLRHAVAALPVSADVDTSVATVFDYAMERLRAYYQDSGVRPDEFDAVLATRPVSPFDFELRVRAVTAFRRLPGSDSLTAANKRIRNILKQVTGGISTQIESTHLAEPAERELHKVLAALLCELGPLLDAGNYSLALERLASLRTPVDEFFDKVMVMSEDAKLRDNRLALLNTLSLLFLRVADLSRLQQ